MNNDKVNAVLRQIESELRARGYAPERVALEDKVGQ